MLACLPQTIFTDVLTTDHARRNLQKTFEPPASFGNAQPPHPRVRTVARDLQALNETTLAVLGSATSTNTLSSDYLQTFILRNPVVPVPAPVLVSPRMTAVLASSSESALSLVAHVRTPGPRHGISFFWRL